MGVLDDMTKGITERKAKAAGPKLTPVGTETSSTKPSGERTLPELQGDVFPHDGGIGGTARFAITNIREELSKITQYTESIEDCLQSIEREAAISVGGPPKQDPFAPTEAELTRRKHEQELNEEYNERVRKAQVGVTASVPKEDVEEDFAARLDRLSANAQAQAFTGHDAESPFNDLPHELVQQGWLCPKHGAKKLKDLTSRKGREYIACAIAGCMEFQK